MNNHSIDYLVFQISRLHYTCIHSRLEMLGLYPGQPSLLHHLVQQDGPSQTELAELMHITTPTLTRMITRMEKAGFVSRVPDPLDQRATRIYLTPLGKITQEKAEQLRFEMDAILTSGFTPEELPQVENILSHLLDNLLNESRDTTL